MFPVQAVVVDVNTLLVVVRGNMLDICQCLFAQDMTSTYCGYWHYRHVIAYAEVDCVLLMSWPHTLQ